MDYKGAYEVTSTYSAGDVVVYGDDGKAYIATGAADAGITPHEKRCWERLIQPFQEIVTMFHGYLFGVDARIPKNISDEAITLKTDDGEYLITVDDSGDTPELAVTEIEEETAEDAGEGGDT